MKAKMKKDDAKNRIVFNFLALKAKFNPQIFLLCIVCSQGIGLVFFIDPIYLSKSGSFLFLYQSLPKYRSGKDPGAFTAKKGR